MTYATLMVHLELGKPNADLLQITANLAQRFQASVIGIAACQPIQYVYGDGFISGQVMEQNRDEIQREADAAETEFRAVLGGRVSGLDWRFAITGASIADYIGEEARSADRSEEHTSELQSLMRISYAVFCLKKKKRDST